MSKEEDDSAANLPVGDHVCCVGVRGGAILGFNHFLTRLTSVRETQQQAFQASFTQRMYGKESFYTVVQVVSIPWRGLNRSDCWRRWRRLDRVSR